MRSVMVSFVFVCLLSMSGICQEPTKYVLSINLSTVNSEQRITVNMYGGNTGWFLVDGSAQSDYWMSLLLRSSEGVYIFRDPSDLDSPTRRWFEITIVKDSDDKILSMTGTLREWYFKDNNWRQRS